MKKLSVVLLAVFAVCSFALSPVALKVNKQFINQVGNNIDLTTNRGLLSSISNFFHNLFGKKDDELTVEKPKKEPEKKLTVMVYVAADNNLEEYAFTNLNMAEMVGSDKNMNIVFMIDRSSEHYTGEGNWTGTKVFYVKKDNDFKKVSSPVVADWGEVNTGDPKTLWKFMKFCHDNYPAKKYFLILWNHGSGWESIPGASVNSDFSVPGLTDSDKDRFIAYDDQAKDSLTLPEVVKVLTAFNKLVGHKLDVFGMDACLVGMTEVMYQLRNVVNVFVGSEKTELGLGWPYHVMLAVIQDNLNKGQNITDVQIGQIAVEAFKQFYDGLSNQYNKDLVNTLAVFAPGKGMDKFAKALKDFVDVAIAEIHKDPTLKKAFLDARKATLLVDDPIKSHIDFGDFFKKVIDKVDNDKVKLAATKVLKEYEALHVENVFTGLQANMDKNPMKNATGLTIYFPTNPKALDASIIAKYLSVVPYRSLDLVKATGWINLLEELVE